MSSFPPLPAPAPGPSHSSSVSLDAYYVASDRLLDDLVSHLCISLSSEVTSSLNRTSRFSRSFPLQHTRLSSSPPSPSSSSSVDRLSHGYDIRDAYLISSTSGVAQQTSTPSSLSDNERRTLIAQAAFPSFGVLSSSSVGELYACLHAHEDIAHETLTAVFEEELSRIRHSKVRCLRRARSILGRARVLSLLSQWGELQAARQGATASYDVFQAAARAAVKGLLAIFHRYGEIKDFIPLEIGNLMDDLHWKVFLCRVGEDTQRIVTLEDIPRDSSTFLYWVEEFRIALERRKTEFEGGSVVVYRMAAVRFMNHRPGPLKRTPQASRRRISKIYTNSTMHIREMLNSLILTVPSGNAPKPVNSNTKDFAREILTSTGYSRMFQSEAERFPHFAASTPLSVSVVKWLFDASLHGSYDSRVYFCLEERIFRLLEAGYEEEEFESENFCPHQNSVFASDIREGRLSFENCPVIGRQILSRRDGRNVEALVVRYGETSRVHFLQARISELLTTDYSSRTRIRAADRKHLQSLYGQFAADSSSALLHNLYVCFIASAESENATSSHMLGLDEHHLQELITVYVVRDSNDALNAIHTCCPERPSGEKKTWNYQYVLMYPSFMTQEPEPRYQYAEVLVQFMSEADHQKAMLHSAPTSIVFEPDCRPSSDALVKQSNRPRSMDSILPVCENNFCMNAAMSPSARLCVRCHRLAIELKDIYIRESSVYPLLKSHPPRIEMSSLYQILSHQSTSYTSLFLEHMDIHAGSRTRQVVSSLLDGSLLKTVVQCTRSALLRIQNRRSVKKSLYTLTKLRSATGSSIASHGETDRGDSSVKSREEHDKIRAAMRVDDAFDSGSSDDDEDADESNDMNGFLDSESSSVRVHWRDPDLEKVEGLALDVEAMRKRVSVLRDVLQRERSVSKRMLSVYAKFEKRSRVDEQERFEKEEMHALREAFAISTSMDSSPSRKTALVKANRKPSPRSLRGRNSHHDLKGSSFFRSDDFDEDEEEALFGAFFDAMDDVWQESFGVDAVDSTDAGEQMQQAMAKERALKEFQSRLHELRKRVDETNQRATIWREYASDGKFGDPAQSVSLHSSMTNDAPNSDDTFSRSNSLLRSSISDGPSMNISPTNLSYVVSSPSRIPSQAAVRSTSSQPRQRLYSPAKISGVSL